MIGLNPETNERTRPRIWAVGGGKGGVGKTVITANMAICLSQLGFICVALDADLGGANLHTVLGMAGPDRTLSDFIRKEVDSLADTMVQTPFPNLRFISGSRALLEMANPKHTQKEKIIRHITTLDVDFVLLDLGSGSAFNTLDFFLAADEGVLVVLPEPTSVENAYHFIKAAFYRKLKKATKLSGVAEAIDKAMEEKVARGIQSPRTLISNVAQIDPEAGQALMEEAATFCPDIIVNQTRRFDDHNLGNDIVHACRDYFGIEIRHIGSIDEDDSLREAVRLRKAVLEAFPASPFSRSIHAIVRNLLDSKRAVP
ncbi:MAG: P-loop NTPase [bacterium]|nr:P-loop NTPase [bacterium]MDT8396633.1 P-loop NTPase [bacterium]